jgi:hypothetical protein
MGADEPWLLRLSHPMIAIAMRAPLPCRSEPTAMMPRTCAGTRPPHDHAMLHSLVISSTPSNVYTLTLRLISCTLANAQSLVKKTFHFFQKNDAQSLVKKKFHFFQKKAINRHAKINLPINYSAVSVALFCLLQEVLCLSPQNILRALHMCAPLQRGSAKSSADCTAHRPIHTRMRACAWLEKRLSMAPVSSSACAHATSPTLRKPASYSCRARPCMYESLNELAAPGHAIYNPPCFHACLTPGMSIRGVSSSRTPCHSRSTSCFRSALTPHAMSWRHSAHYEGSAYDSNTLLTPGPNTPATLPQTLPFESRRRQPVAAV